MTFIYFVLVLSITIFVHELGHFIFAKKAGIYVYEFCIGMGPRIFKFKRKNDETEYGIRLFPIGGFCSMAGEGMEQDKDIPEIAKMQSKTWTERFLTVIAGVMFNFLFAIVILFIIGLINGNTYHTLVVTNVKEDSVLNINDKIVKVDKVKVKDYDRFMLEYQVNYGKDLKLVVERNGQKYDVVLKPEVVDDGYIYGFELGYNVEKGFIPAIKYAITKFNSLMLQMVVTISYLFTGKISLSSLSGPVGIYNIVGQSARAGFLNIIYLIAYLCINVGFINLLPFPAFDGGRVLFLIIEKIKGSKVDVKFENLIHSIGLILLMILMFIITYNDIFRFIIKR